MNTRSATREQIIEAKEKLNRMAEDATDRESRRVAKEHWEKTQAEEREQEAARMLYHQNQAEYLAQKEKNRVEAKAKEEEAHLRRHNKNVKQVLSQVAKASRQGKDSDMDGDDEDSEAEGSSDESEIETHQGKQNQQRKQSVSSQVIATAVVPGKQKEAGTKKHLRDREHYSFFFFPLTSFGSRSFLRGYYIVSTTCLERAAKGA